MAFTYSVVGSYCEWYIHRYLKQWSESHCVTWDLSIVSLWQQTFASRHRPLCTVKSPLAPYGAVINPNSRKIHLLYTRNQDFRSRLIVLWHWPHVATQVAQQVAQLVASVKGLGHKLSNLLLNLCPSAACAATSCVHRRPRLYLDVTKGVHYVVESHGYSLQIRKWNS